MRELILSICMGIGIGSLKCYTDGGGFMYAIGILIGIGVIFFYPDNSLENFVITGKLDFDGLPPLVFPGHMRKKAKRNRIFSSVKEVYICQIIIAIQFFIMIAFEVYHKFQYMLYTQYVAIVYEMGFILTVSIVGSVGVAGYLRYTLLKRRKKTTYLKYKWKPFHDISVPDSEAVTDVNAEIHLDEMKSKICEVYSDSDTFLKENVKRKNLEISFYGKKVNEKTEVLTLIQTDELKKEHIEELNTIYEKVMREALSGTLLALDIMFTEIFYVEKMSQELEKIVCGIAYQEPDKFYLPVAIIKNRGKIYIADQVDSQGLEEYKAMKKNMLVLLCMCRK